MSLIPRCVQCDSPTDPYGRDGGMPLCKRCLTELRQPVPYTPISFDTDPETGNDRVAA